MEDADDLASLLDDTRDETSRHWAIGDLARRCDVTLRALRFYEAKGLLDPVRLGQARRYRAEDIRRLQIVVAAKRLGFGLAEIREILDLRGRAPIEARRTDLRTRLALRRNEMLTARAEAERTLERIALEIAALDRVSPPGA
jgi:DNA-binding transcriptional MerR regulator